MKFVAHRFLVIALGVLASAFTFEQVAASTDIKLVLVIVIDQMHADRLTQELPGGLGRLVREGRVYRDAWLNHGVTNTCPGHAVVLTGKNPSALGIIGNESFDRDTWKTRYCVDDTEFDRSPRAMQGTTLGDWLKSADPSARVISMSIKDRAAITLGGQAADLALWFDRDRGLFTTSRYYIEGPGDLPGWVKQFNGEAPLEDGYLSTLPEQWVHPGGRFRDDDFAAESDEFSRTSPHPLRTGGIDDVAKQFYASPFADRATGELAISAIRQEQLGQRGHRDLLAVSFSASDTVGHLYGPLSAESEDALRVLDEVMAQLFDTLDQLFEHGEVLTVLTADHGVVPLPEGRNPGEAGACPQKEARAPATPLIFSLYSQLYWRFTFPFGNPFDLVAVAGPQVYINERYARALGHRAEEVVSFVETYLEQQPFIEAAWRPDEFLNSDAGYAPLYRNSWLPEFGGDLIIQNAEGCLIGGDHGTTHGTPYDYDRRVPLIFHGGGIAPGTVGGEVHSVDIAPTLAPLLGITSPGELQGRNLFNDTDI